MGRGCCRAPAHGCAHRGLQWVHWAVMGCGTAYIVKGPTVRCTWLGMMVWRSANRALQLSPWYTQSVFSSAILGRSFRASRFMVLLRVASVTVPDPALMRRSRFFWCCAAARLRAALRAVLLAAVCIGVGVMCSG